MKNIITRVALLVVASSFVVLGGATAAHAQYDDSWTSSDYGSLSDYGGGYDNSWSSSDYGSMYDYSGGYDNTWSSSDYGSMYDYSGGYDNTWSSSDYGYLNDYGSAYDNTWTGSDYGSLNDYGSGYDNSWSSSDYGYLNDYGSAYDNTWTGSDYGYLNDYSGYADGTYGSGYADGLYGSGYADGTYGSGYADGLYGSGYAAGGCGTFCGSSTFGGGYNAPRYSSGGYSTGGGYSSGGGYSMPVTAPRYAGGVGFSAANIGRPTTIGQSASIGYSTQIARPVTVTAPIYQAQPQRTVQYTYPQQPQYLPQPSCTITVSQSAYTNYVTSQPVTLTWTSVNATSAHITPNIGTVSTYGSRTVYPTGTQTYTMTVTGQGGTGTCQVTVQYIPQPTPYPVPTPVPYPVPTPVPTPIYNNPLSCSITASPNAIRNGQSATLSWTSYGATYASLNDGLGTVAPSGSLRVTPEASRTYVLTVYGYNGQTTTCTTHLSVSGAAPYVSLSQIPYTGFDLGVIGNTLYWALMIAFAAAAAYLVLYSQSGTYALAGFGKFSTSRIITPKHAARQTPAAEAVATPYVVDAPVAIPSVLSADEIARVTKDSMHVVDAKDGEMPRIVISRA